MKSQLNWGDSHNFELPSHATASQRSFGTRLSDLWHSTLAYLKPSSEPHVWKTEDAMGYPAWSAYDPITRRSIEQVSAHELRVWLEERHYQGI